MRVGIAIFSFVLFLAAGAFADVTLVDNGDVRCVVVVPERIMAANTFEFVPGDGITTPRIPEFQRQQLRAAAKDLARYLGKMSGTNIGVVTNTASSGMIPIYVGDLAIEKFGKPRKSAPYRQGFRVFVSSEGVGLCGESDLASSYAIYEVLDRLGCRWFMPSEWGECIPEMKTISLAAMDFNSTPGTIYRGIWKADEDYKRRNRYGGMPLSASHALDSYVSKAQRAEHPDWIPIFNGKPVPEGIKWTKPEIADAMSTKIISLLDKGVYNESVSLTPEDGNGFDESEDPKFDAGDWDPIWNMNSLTDRLMVLCNRVATRVTQKYPDVVFGFLPYVNYTRPPVREKLHPNLIPVIAPITYCRAHPSNDEGDPNAAALRHLIEGWGKSAKMTGCYYYCYFLGEFLAPFPQIRKWSVDVPFALENRCQFFQPETTGNFEMAMHALWLGPRLAWDPSRKPEEVINEINTRFYGNAATEMAGYWDYVDRIWVETPEYSGAGHGQLRRFTPERMKKMRELLTAAKRKAITPQEKFRITMNDESLILFEKYMHIRTDLAEGRWSKLNDDARYLIGRTHSMAERYRAQYAFTPRDFGKAGNWGSNDGVDFFSSWYRPTCEDANRIATWYDVLTVPPIRQWRFEVDKERNGEALNWPTATFDDTKWRTTDPVVDSWSALGYHNYFGRMWYRTSVKIPATTAGKKTWLWIGAADGGVKVFVNGRHVPYLAPDGRSAEEFSSYMQPATWNISEAIKDGMNQITVLTTRSDKEANEVGTGGLMGPAAIYRDRN